VAQNVKTRFDPIRNEVHCEFALPVNLHYFHLLPTWNFSLIRDETRHNKYYNLLAAGTVTGSSQSTKLRFRLRIESVSLSVVVGFGLQGSSGATSTSLSRDMSIIGGVIRISVSST